MGRMSSNTSPGELSMTPSTASFDSQSSYSSCESQDSTEGRAKTHSLTPTRAAIANAAPQPAQGAASNLTERRKSRVDSARSQRSHSEQPDVQRQKMTTPYGHVLTKNGYIMVSKMRAGRSKFAKTTKTNQKVDPITARILSANRKKRALQTNQAGELKNKNNQLEDEIKSLRILCKNQEKSLRQFESTQSALPRVLTSFEHDKTVLKERLRKTKENEKRLEREKKRADLLNIKNQKRIDEYITILQAKDLGERWILQKQLEETGQRAVEAEQRICELTRHFDLQNSALERQLKKEIRRRTKAENENEKHKGEIREIKEKLTEKEKQLNYSNIYIQRQNKRTKKQNLSSSLALPAPESKEEQAAGDITNPIGKALASNQQDLALSDKSQSRQSSRADKKSTTSTFLTDIVEPNNPADLNDFELETLETVTAPLVSMGAALSQEAPNQESPLVSPAEATEEEATVFTENPPKPIPSSTLDQEAEVVGQPEEQRKERSGDALLDEMLFGGATKAVESPNVTDSPQLFEVEHNEDVPIVKKASKESVLEQLLDSTVDPAESKPEIELDSDVGPEIVNKVDKLDFKIFDDPKIDPKEKPKSKEIELDDLLNLGRKNSKTYNWTEPTKNLHQGKSATGKDFRNPLKKDTLIDDLFGGGGNKLALGPQW